MIVDSLALYNIIVQHELLQQLSSYLVAKLLICFLEDTQHVLQYSKFSNCFPYDIPLSKAFLTKLKVNNKEINTIYRIIQYMLQTLASLEPGQLLLLQTNAK